MFVQVLLNRETEFLEDESSFTRRGWDEEGILMVYCSSIWMEVSILTMREPAAVIHFENLNGGSCKTRTDARRPTHQTT